MASTDLTTAANVKAQAGMTGAADGVIISLIAQASAFIAKLTDRVFTGTQAVTEIRNGSGGTELFLSEGPVSSITYTTSSDTGLTIDARPIVPQPADGQPGYFLVNSELLCLYGYAFTRGKRNVRVKYTAGYATPPKEIEQACVELVVAAYRRVPRGPEMRSETIPVTGAVVSFDLKDIPAYAARAIDAYRKVVPL